MEKNTVEAGPAQSGISEKSALEDVLREGARRMLQSAIEGEVADYVEIRSAEKDADGHRVVVRNGYLPERELTTGIGPVKVRQPRVNDKRSGEKFTSQILPPFMRRVPSIDALIPCLYLKGVSTGDFAGALEAILGPRATGLSATNVVCHQVFHAGEPGGGFFGPKPDT